MSITEKIGFLAITPKEEQKSKYSIIKI